MKIIYSFLSIIFVTEMVLAGSVQKVTFPLIEGKGNSGLMLTANYLENFNILDNFSQIVLTAKKTNDNFVSSNSKNLLPLAIYIDVQKGENILSIKSPALINFHSDSVKYKNAWLWGSNVLLGVDYMLKGKKIPWRTDYACITVNSCKLKLVPQDQLFELSYMLSKESQPALEKNINIKSFTSDIYWSDPANHPVFDLTSTVKDKNSLHWSLVLEKVAVTLTKGNKGWNANSDPVVKLFSKLLNDYASKELVEYDEVLDNIPDNKNKQTYSFFSYKVIDNKQLAKSLVYKKQVYDLITKWNKIRVIGKFEFSDRGFLYFYPISSKTIEAINTKEKLELNIPVMVFEYSKNKSIQPGVGTDFRATLLSNTYLLDSIRFKTDLWFCSEFKVNSDKCSKS